MSPPLRIGIDFDNTIIAYDDVFREAAQRDGLIGADFSGGKQAVRDAIRLLPDGELAWQRLQGQAYGKGIAQATLIAGVTDFLRRCKAEHATAIIVSHKTEYGHFDADKVNLHTAALGWMKAKGLLDVDDAIPPGNVHFESTRAEKLKRIAALSLTHFIDDLPEVLTDPGFPAGVQRILFAERTELPRTSLVVCPTWHDIERSIFDGDRN